MRQCLQFLHHLGIAFVDLALRIWEWSATLPPTQQVVLMVPFDLMQQRCKGARRTIKECSCCVRKSHTQVGGKMVACPVRGHVNAKCKLLPADGAWWSMLVLVTDLYLNVSQSFHPVLIWLQRITVLKFQEIHLGSYEDWWLKQRWLVQEIAGELHLLRIAGCPQNGFVVFCRRAEKRDLCKKTPIK